MQTYADEIFRRFQTAAQTLQPETVAAFVGPAGKNIDRFLTWSIQNGKFKAEILLNTSGPLPGIEEFVMSFTDLKESSRRVYESRLRSYAHQSKHFLPLLPRTAQLLRNDPEFLQAASQLLGLESSEHVASGISKRWALAFSASGATLVINDIARESDREWFKERRSRFAKAGSSAAKVNAVEMLRALANQLELIRQTDATLKNILTSLRALPEVVSVHADEKEALLATLNEAVADLRVQARLLEKGE